MGFFKNKTKPTTFGSYTARTGHDENGLFQQDILSFGQPAVLPLASKTTSISGRGPLTDHRGEGKVVGLDGMMPPALTTYDSAQPGGPSFAGSGGAGSFATVVAKGAKG